MQLISAVVRPSRVTQICDALQAFGFQGMTVTDVSGLGKLRGHTEIYRGAEYESGFEPRVKVEIVARDEDVHDMIEVICRVAATGRLGDGKIWATPVGELVRIRTREVGSDAL
jgi:nitrogen regulatory protein P-II 1